MKFDSYIISGKLVSFFVKEGSGEY